MDRIGWVIWIALERAIDKGNFHFWPWQKHKTISKLSAFINKLHWMNKTKSDLLQYSMNYTWQISGNDIVIKDHTHLLIIIIDNENLFTDFFGLICILLLKYRWLTFIPVSNLDQQIHEITNIKSVTMWCWKLIPVEIISTRWL